MIYARCMYDWSKGHLATRYRLVVFGSPAAPWRETLFEVHDDAVDLGHASRNKTGDRSFWMNGYADVWCVKACPATEKQLRSRRRRLLVEVANLNGQRCAAA